MIKTLRCFGLSFVRCLCYRSTVGLAVLTFCVFLPLFSRGDLSVRLKYFSSVGSTNVTYVSFSNILDEEALYDVYMSRPFGILFHNLSSISSPNTSTSSSWYYSMLNNQINPTGSGTSYTNSPAHYPRVFSLYNVAASLKSNGYDGPGLVFFASVGSRSCYNVYFPDIIANVFSSTNSIYRSIVLSHLSAISSSVQNIELNTTGLQSSVDRGNDMLSSISNSSLSALSTLSDISLSSSVSSAFLSQVSSNTSASAASLAQVSSNTIASAASLAQVSSNTVASVASLSDISSNTFSSASSLRSVSDGVSDVFGQLGQITTYIGPSGISGDVDSIKKSSDSLSRSIAASLFGSSVPSPNNPFYPYDPNNPSDPNHPSNPDSPWNPQSPNFVGGGGGQGAFTTNNVVRPITNVVRQASSDIQSNATENADRQIDNTNDIWDDFQRLAFGNGEGLNVRIKYPLWESDSFHVNVRDDAVLSAIDNLHAMPVELTAIKDNIQWFKDGGPMNINLPTNLVDILDDILDSLTNRPVNSYLLLDDYAVYISNGVYQSSIEQLENDFPNVYTNLQKYGLTSSGDGNFWTLFGANLIYQSGLIGSLLEDMATIRKFADDHIEGGFSAGIKSIVEKFPSPTQLEDDVNNATSRLSEISIASTDFVHIFETITNSSYSVFKPFADSFDFPPSGDIVFFKTANAQYVSIPVHEQASVWSLIRMGIGFALIGVQFLLFPKFVLAVVVLFSRLSSRFVKFVPTDR